MKKAVVDVCYTLYSRNTTFAFIDYVLLRKFNKKSYLANKYLKFFLVVIGKIVKRDLYRRFYIRHLKGLKKIDLKELAHDFYYDVLDDNKIKAVFSLLEKNKNDYKFILCSASLDIIVEAIISNNYIFESKFYSSQLRFVDDVCEGILDNDLLGYKHQHIGEIDWVITDNKSDLELVKRAKTSTIIAKNKHVYFWNKNGIEVDIII